MSTLLQINSGIFGADSRSSAMADAFVEQWMASRPGHRLIRRDLGEQPVPHLDAATIAAISTPPEEQTPEQSEAARYADHLIAELKEADTLVLGVPMYNFGVPSALKAWFDHVARAGDTFRYTESGPEGLLRDKKVYVFAARGGIYAGTEQDVQTPFIRQFLGFLGISDVEFVYAEGLNMSDALREERLSEAADRIAELAAA